MTRQDRRTVRLAQAIATLAHDGQAYGDDDYVEAHVARVVNRVEWATGASAVHVAAAWLHDVLEDTSYDVEDLAGYGLPARVIDLVQTLTRRADETYFEYIERVALDPDATLIKREDLQANLEASDESDPAYRPKRAERYRKALDKLNRKAQDSTTDGAQRAEED